ncbi:MAG: zinc-ribbon domain-containing protein [Myxococcota bacterium]|nr:zinc-ribbon domain-containing protein [Myxococcota bacterium]
MEFNCPACDTLHEFPDDEIPPAGVVVACTECGKHISLARDMSFGDDTAAAPLSDDVDSSSPESISSEAVESVSVNFEPESELSSSAPKVEHDQSLEDWPAQQDSRILRYDPLSLAVSPVGDQDERQVRRRVSKVVQPQSGLARALDTLGRRQGATTEPERTPDLSVEDRIHPTRFSSAFWFIVRDSIRGIFDGERLVFATVGFWMTLVGGALLGWVGQWLGQKIAILGTLLSWSSAFVSMAGFILVSAVLSAQSSGKIAGASDANIRYAIARIRRSTGIVLGVPFLFLGVVCSAIILISLFGFLGRVPTIGPVAWGALSSVVVALGVLAGFAGTALALAIPLYVPIGLESSVRPLDVIRTLAALFRDKPATLVSTFAGLALSLGVLMLLVLGPTFWIGQRIVSLVSAQTMKEDFWSIVARIPDEFAGAASVALGTLPMGPATTPSSIHEFGALFTGIGMTFGPALCLAIFMAAFQRGGVLFLRQH